MKLEMDESKKRKSDEMIENDWDDGEDDVEFLEVLKKSKSLPVRDECIVLDDDDVVVSRLMSEKAECPVCGQSFFKDLINSHVNGHFL